MSETKLTRYDWAPHSMVQHPSGSYYDASDADALLAERDAEIARLRAQIESDLKERNTVVELGNAYGKAQYENVGRLGEMLKEATSQLTAHREAVRVLAEYYVAENSDAADRAGRFDGGVNSMMDYEKALTRIDNAVEAIHANPIASTALRSAGEE